MNRAPETSYEVVETEMTPNPNALKFILNHPIMASGSLSFHSLTEAEHHGMARVLFAMGNMQSVYLNENYVSVTLIDGDTWPVLKDTVEAVIEDYATFHEEVEEEHAVDSILDQFKPEDYDKLSDGERMGIVDAILDQKVRSALAADGGGMEVVEVEGIVVRIRYQGACGGCPMSETGTLRAIENILRHHAHPDIRVQIQSNYF